MSFANMTKKNIEKTAFVIFGLLVFFYLMIRAIYVPFLHDEASTFFRFVQIGKLSPEFSREALNNHLLNTLLTYISYILLGDSKIALRLPNVLSFIIYLVFVYKSSQYLTSSICKYGYIIALCLSHYFIEFFAISRGYGISMAFFMAALYFLMKGINSFHPKYHLMAAFSMLLMVASNLNLIIPVIAISGIQLVWVIQHFNTINANRYWMIIVFFLINISTISVSAIYMNQLRVYDAFYLGTENGFIDATMKSLIRLLTGNNNIYVIVTVIFTAVVLIAIKQVLHTGLKLFKSANFTFVIVLLASLVGIFLAVQFFGINYPEDRAVIYFFPLFTGSTFFMIDSLKNRYKRLPALITLPFIFLPLHFIINVNTSYVNGYKTETMPERFYTRIANEHEKTGKLPTIGGSNMRAFVWTYMNYANGGHENVVDWTAYPDTTSLFQILETNNYPYSLEKYDSLDYASYSGLTLFKRKKPVNKLKIAEIKITKPETIEGKKYHNLLEIKADTIKNKQFYIELNLHVKASNTPFDALLVLQGIDKNKKTVIYDFIPFGWLKQKWDEQISQFHKIMSLGPVPEDTELIKIYIWDRNKMSFTLHKGRIDIFELN